MHHTATVGSGTINLLKTIVGSGLLAIPFAFRMDGVLVGVALTFFAAFTSAFGMFILGKCSKTLINPRNSSFFTICMLTYPSLSPVFDLIMIVQCFGCGLSYLVLFGDIFPTLFGGERENWILLSALIVWPLCFLKKMDHLRFSSFIGIVALLYLTLLVVGYFINDVFITDHYKDVRGEVNWIKVYDSKGLLSTFSIIVFSYAGAMNLFNIINELKDNSLRNIKRTIGYSILISTAMFLTVGISGYLTFGTNTRGNILLDYDPNSHWVSFGKFALAIMLILSFPLQFHPLRIAVNNLVVWTEMQYAKTRGVQETENYYENDTLSSVHSRQNDIQRARTPITLSIETGDHRSDGNNNDNIDAENASSGTEPDIEPGEEEMHVSFPNMRFYGITVVVLSIMYTLAMRVTSFATVLALVGATGSTSISFTFPGLFGHKMIGQDSLAVGQLIPPWDRFYKRCSLALVFFGLAVMCLSLYVTITESFQMTR